MSWKMSGRVKNIVAGAHGEDITPAQKLVLMVLADDHNEDEGHAWPSMDRLAERCIMTVRGTQEAMRHLEEVGLVRTEQVPGKRSRYFLLPETPELFAAVQKERPEAAIGVKMDAEKPTVSFKNHQTKRAADIQSEPNRTESEDQKPCRSCGEIGRHTCGGARKPLKKPKREKRKRVAFINETREELPSEVRGKVVDVHKFWVELRKKFKAKIGRAMGNVGGTPAERFNEACERHSTEAVEKAFDLWMETEERFLSTVRSPAMRFIYGIDGWIAEATTETVVKQDEDRNKELALTNKGKEKYRKFEAS